MPFEATDALATLVATTAVGRRRWLAKKASRGVVALACWSSGSLRVRNRVRRLRAITYHRFGDVPRDPFCMLPARFEAQMHWLAQEGLAVSLEQLDQFLQGADDVPDGGVLVTIDDGHRSLRTHALPVLERYGVPAVAFVTAGLVGNREASRAAAEPYLGWEELVEVAQRGVAIGSHSFHHRSLGALDAEAVRGEGQRSRELLEERLQRPVHSFAYPFGTRTDYDATTGRILGETGYRSVFTSQHGSIRRGANPLELPRVKVEAGEGLTMFRLLCRGGLDAWALVDGALWWLQQGRSETLAGD
jgi:peptidoglycan/xylan/chitin deacetylase (PgdA/CDA1 family)